MSNLATWLNGELIPERELPGAEEIRSQLHEILSSPAFQGSKRCRQFLAFVCEKALAGETGSLKERTIAVEVFGRKPQSDLADDTIVRVSAREVRKRLQQYYLTPSGASASVQISLPTGSYSPEFHRSKPATDTVVMELPAVAPKPKRRKWVVFALALPVVAAAVFFSVEWTRSSPEEQAFSRFWGPVFHNSDDVLVVVPNPIVYHPSARAWRLSEQNMPQGGIVPHPIQVPPGKLNGSDMLPVQNQYVGFGDLIATDELTSMLARHARKSRIRMSSEVPFPDLRTTATVLVGAITNRWTMQFQQNWRFQFLWKPAVRTVVVDTQQHREWNVDAIPIEAYKEDYVVVSRIRNSPTGALLVVGAGLKGFGTEAAGRLLADSGQLGSLLRKLPPGWDDKNVQIVLHVKVIGNAPAEPELVAWHVW